MTAPVHERLEAFLRQQAWLWNHFLAERKRVYKQAKQGVRYADQQKALTLLRQAQRKFSQYRLAAQRSALRRLDKAFQAFFRRCKAGEKPGYPRFKRRRGLLGYGRDRRRCRAGLQHALPGDLQAPLAAIAAGIAGAAAAYWWPLVALSVESAGFPLAAR